MQQAVIVKCVSGAGKNSPFHYRRCLSELNEELQTGWHVVSATPMGAGGDTSDVYSLVIIEKDDK